MIIPTILICVMDEFLQACRVVRWYRVCFIKITERMFWFEYGQSKDSF